MQLQKPATCCYILYTGTMNDGINIFAPEYNDPMSLPLSDSRVAAGFPSPAEDYASMRLDLNRELIKNPASTF